jgi:hypothetical protein
MSDRWVNLNPLTEVPTIASLATAFQRQLAPALARPRRFVTSRLAAMLGRTELPGRDELAALRPASRVLLVGLAAWIAMVGIVTLIAVAWVELSTMSFPAWFDPRGTASAAVKTRSHASFDNIVQHPLFSRARQVAVTTPVALRPPPQPPLAVALDKGIVLKGVFINGAQAKAFLVSPQNPIGAWLQAGDTIAGWKVVSLKPDEVVLEGQNEQLAVSLSNKGPTK